MSSCKVCNSSNRVSLHFGATTICAACAAFFRRTVTEAKKFRCLRQQKCNVDQAIRNVCRACRFAKCQSVGMDVAEVQPKRDAPRGLQKRINTTIEIEDKSITVLPNHVDVGASPHAPAYQAPNHWKSREITAPQARKYRPGCLLDEVIESYHKLLDRRKFILSDFMPLKSFFSNEPQTFAQIKPLTKESTMLLRRREMALIADFMQSLRPLVHFSIDDKFQLFKQFGMQFYFVEACYRSYLNNGFQTNCFTMLTGEKINVNNCEEFFQKFATKILDGATIKKLYQSVLVQGMRDIVGPMTVMEMTEREMLALNLILLYNNQNIVELNCDQQSALAKAKDEVLGELHDYYCENNITDGEIRLGSLILLAPAVLDWSFKKKEQFELSRFFELFTPDENLSELYD